MEYLALAVRCLIGFTFAASAIGKVRGRAARAEFVVATAALLSAVLAGRTPRWAGVRSLAAVVIGAEFAIVVLLVVPATQPSGFCLAAALLAAFCVAIACAIRRGVRTACHCFGGSAAPVGRAHLVRNGLLLVAAVAGWGLGPAGVAHLEPVGVVVGAASGIVVAAMLVRLDDLVDLVRPPSSTGHGRRGDRGGTGRVSSAPVRRSVR